ncbi:MAG: response regulator [Hyphomicrobiales bacterium]|nr:response regulator [Hyphomicrobiales bacterium]
MTQLSQPLTPSILLADPSAEMRARLIESVKLVFPAARCLEAATGPEALGILRSGSVQAMIMDVAMPILSGPDVITEAHKEGVRPFLILTSSVVLPNWSMMSVALQAYEYLKKPFLGEDIENLLQNYLRMQTPTRLLLADAGDQSRNVVRKVINSSRFKVIIDETDNGGHALKLSRMQSFDAMFIDANLAGISGLETACQIQNLHPELMVVSIVPSMDNRLAQSLKHMGLAHVLSKPFFTRDVDTMLHTAHKLRRPYLMNAVIKAAQTALAV